ncbi:MAG: ACP S-malonyltransferase, partial [Candidatus Eisenbacteria bacterium]
GVRPGIVAGHSLGEYSALVAAKVLEPRDAIAAVKRRAELMFEAGTSRPGTMAAIMGLSQAEVAQVCREAEEAGIVQPANFNAPGQLVISGEVGAVEKAMELATKRGAKRAVPLPVSGAFHSELMAHAAEGLEEALRATPFRDADVPVVVNVDAAPLAKGDDLRDALVRQLRGAVRWEESMRRMKDEGFTRFHEVGPGRVLQGLARKIDRSFEVESVDGPESFRKAVGPRPE